MPGYIVLINFTDQGIRTIKQLRERIQAGTAVAEKLGIKVKDAYLTMGAFDAVLVADSPNDETMTAWALDTGSVGNIRTQTLRAYTAEETSRILAKLP
jgi:uncharacterized protein with GYD domain